MKLLVQVKGRKELEAQLAQLKGTMMDQALVNALLAGAQPIQNRWAEMAPWKTGKYRRSIHSEAKNGSGMNAEVDIGTSITDPPYPLFLEYGTAPYTILPRIKKALYWEGAEHPVKHVHHPGIKAHPSARPAFDEKRGEALRLIRDKFRMLILRVARA